MPTKHLQEVAEDDVIFRLNSLAAIAGFVVDDSSLVSGAASAKGMGFKEVWGVKEAKTRLSALLTEASGGDILFVTAGDGTPIAMISAKVLADAVATIEEQRGMTFSEALQQLPYAPSELAPISLRHRGPTRGLMQMQRVPIHEEA